MLLAGHTSPPTDQSPSDFADKEDRRSNVDNNGELLLTEMLLVL